MKRLFLVTFAALLVTTGCRADISTSLDVSGAGETAITVGFKATGTLAEALHDTSVERQVLSALISSRSGEPTELHLQDGEVVWSGELTYQQMLASRDLTGVGDAIIQVSKDRVTAAIGTFRPTDLLTAFIEAGESRPDGADVAAAYAANTFITLEVSVPYDATVVSTGALDTSKIRIETTETTVTVTSSVDNWKETAIVISGARSAPFDFGNFLKIAIYVSVCLMAVMVIANRWIRADRTN